MRFAIDPCQFRSVPIGEAIGVVAAAGFDAIELSPRDGLLEHRSSRRPDPGEVDRLHKACARNGIRVASVFIVQPWASTDPDERVAAVRGLEVALEMAAMLGCERVNTELTGTPVDAVGSRAAFMRSVEELLPSLERRGQIVTVEPHPFDFFETSDATVDLLSEIDSPLLRYLFCLPHRFYLGEDLEAMLRHARHVLDHVHVADTYRPSRIIANPPGDQRLHQHLDIGQGELDWDAVADGLAAIGYSGLMTVAAFAWPDRAAESAEANRQAVDRRFGTSAVRSPAQGKEGGDG